MAVTENDLRRMLQDPEGDKQLLESEDYDLILSYESGLYKASAMGARMIAGIFAKKMKFKVGPLSIDVSDKYKQYNDLASTWEKKANSDISSSTSAATPTLTGVSNSEMDAVRENTDRPDSKFEMGLTDYDGPNSDEGDGED